MKCPCDLCITRAICLNKEHEDLLGCGIIRKYLDINTSGNLNVVRLETFCRSMNLDLRVRRPIHSSGTSSYSIQHRKEGS